MPHTGNTPDNLRAKAEESGWPDDLIQQALARGATPDQIIGYMDQGVTAEQARRFLAAATGGGAAPPEAIATPATTRPVREERFAAATFNGHRLATVLHDASTSRVVVFCHGFQGHKGGPNGRFFVRAARTLASHGIASLRFDQFGCGDSEGDSTDSSFRDWIATTRAIAERYLTLGYRVALFGHSMGAAAALCVAAELRGLTSPSSLLRRASSRKVANSRETTIGVKRTTPGSPNGSSSSTHRPISCSAPWIISSTTRTCRHW